jgi:hypothetical protein
MRTNRSVSFLVLFLSLVLPGVAQQKAARKSAPAATGEKRSFDPHSLAGVWIGYERYGNGRFDNPVPEPPLTEWGKRNLLYRSISHDSMAGTLNDPAKVPDPKVSYSGDRRFFSADPYGVRTSDPGGEYPGKDCEPLATPATFDYPTFNPMEFVATPDRIFQYFEYHREWRTWWMNREHPQDIEPTYEGESVAHWEGDTLVVDTAGYNGKTMISGAVGHRKSDAFRLVERYRRVDEDHLELEMTYYDPKAWGDKSWPGFHKYFKRVPKESFEEFICSIREYHEYDNQVTDTMNGASPK